MPALIKALPDSAAVAVEELVASVDKVGRVAAVPAVVAAQAVVLAGARADEVAHDRLLA